jgi:hypothetical protein
MAAAAFDAAGDTTAVDDVDVADDRDLDDFPVTIAVAITATRWMWHCYHSRRVPPRENPRPFSGEVLMACNALLADDGGPRGQMGRPAFVRHPWRTWASADAPGR